MPTYTVHYSNTANSPPFGDPPSVTTDSLEEAVRFAEKHFIAPPHQPSVGDHGSGMTPEVARRALEPFFTTKPLGKGTGLGLSMVKSVVEQSSGRMEVETEREAGTTIRLVFPMVQPTATASS